MKVLVIDNYDSFVYNLVQYIGELGGDVMVYRNDQVTLKQIKEFEPQRIVISPGPGTPEETRYFGVSSQILRSPQLRSPNLGSMPRPPGNNPCLRRKNRLCKAAYAWKNQLNKTRWKGHFQGRPEPVHCDTLPFTGWR